MKTFSVTRYKCGEQEFTTPYKCVVCHIEFSQVYWYYISEHFFFNSEYAWVHSVECANMYILQHMGE